MTVNAMREAVIAAYSGPVWRLKGPEMPDRQVIAIFKSMIDEGRLGPGGKLLKKPSEPTSKGLEPKVQQLTIWDFYDKDGF